MRVRDSVHSKARELRAALGNGHQPVLEKLRALLRDKHGIELVAVDRKHFLQDGRGEIVPAEGALYYARDLEDKPEELLEVVAHEYGHLVLHHQAFGVRADDLIRGSVFLDSGSAALSRYSPRSRAETEASAFAAEFICPGREIFARWRSAPDLSLPDLAAEYQATPRLVRQQLAEGLYAFIIGTSSEAQSNGENPPTPDQEHAATCCGVPVLVDAGPGTGKTRTLVRRIEYLIREKHVEPERILVLTFSNEAATELQERILKSLGEDVASRILATTFHGFGVAMLHATGHHIGLDVDFTILDDICQEELVADLLGDVDCEALLDIKDPSQTATEVVRLINYLKDRLITPDQLAESIDDWPPGERDGESIARSLALLRLYRRYEEVKDERRQVDFADLICRPYQVLANREDLRDRVRHDFSWVLVDEYQDVSRSTALLLAQLCGTANPPWVVGDARQAIYRFRGAAPENVKEFDRDFPGARRYELIANYRSAPEIVHVVNQLAVLLEDPGHVGAVPERWRSATDVVAFGQTPAALAQATSDAAERDGIVGAIQGWLHAGAIPSHIAVLARRNVDVRNIAIALNRCGIRAVTSGLLTAEGAGGDLAAVVSVPDLQQALSRITYAIGRRRAAPAVLNEVVRQVLQRQADDDISPFVGPKGVQALASEVWGVFKSLRTQVHSADAWNVLCDFLFFCSQYIRELLDDPDDPARSVQLEEVLSALSLAAQYRFTHPHVRPRWSRLGLAERLRNLVTQPTPGLVPPRADVNAVRVMTCHASKGLEFPCVAVAGQSLADVPPPKQTLPPQLRPDRDDDALQAESLLFVGVSRAKRCVLVSYATSASGTPRSRRRRFPRLLTRLHESNVLPFAKWDSASDVAEDIAVARIWGGDTPSGISMYALGSKTCRVRTYVEEQLGARFRGRLRPLYPEFIDRTRRMLRRVVLRTVESKHRLSEGQINQIVDEEWPAEHRKDHPHVDLYRPRARDWAQALGRTIDVHRLSDATGYEETFEWADTTGTPHALKLQLIAQLIDRAGDRIVIGLEAKASAGPAVKWSDLSDYHRLPFVLLHDRHHDVQPFVFSGSDGEIRPFRWSQRKPDEAIAAEAASAKVAFHGLVTGHYDGRVDDWTCDRCGARTLCPWWLGAS
jgi:DNA helicase II / ATP-dependent DNA helicase PcrA